VLDEVFRQGHLSKLGRHSAIGPVHSENSCFTISGLFIILAGALSLRFVNLWIHVLSLCFYFGSVAGFLLLFLPTLNRLRDSRIKGDLLARGLRFYNPLQIGSLGVLVMSGAFDLTQYKMKGPGVFLGVFGSYLPLKLTLVFFLVLLSVYQTMGIAYPGLRRYEANEEAFSWDPLVPKLRVTSWIILALTAAVAFVGLKLTHR
jgi:hypothetical protein